MVTLLALVVFGGGVAYAAGQLAKNSVGPKQLRKNAVRSSKVKDRSLKAVDFADGELPAGPAGPPGTPGTSHAYEASGSVNFDKISSSLYGSDVVGLVVPPGAYFATASVQVQDVNMVEGTVQCRLIDGNGGAESTWAVQGSQEVRKDGYVDNFTLTGLFEVTPGQKLNLQCSKSEPASGARITEANVTAVQVSDVTHNSK